MIKVFLLFLSLGLLSCSGKPLLSAEAELTTDNREYITIVAVGDNLIHHPIIEASLKDGLYDFHYIFDPIREYILPADIAFINQETILGNEELGFSGWPQFSSPPEVGAAVVAAGFDVINFANNHALDRGEAGVISSIEYLDNYDDVYYLGIHRSAEERMDRRVILSRNGITVGFLGYSFGTNGIPFPSGKTYLVSLIQRETIAAEIKALRPYCDYLVVSMHWGAEYALNYSGQQEQLAAFLAEQQVDLVIGHHPHVLQPMVIMTRPDGKPMPVFYSLGNFLSSHIRSSKEALLGGIMYVRIAKDGDEISLEETGLIPIITHFDIARRNFGIYPLHEYTDEQAAQHWRKRAGAGDPEMALDFFMNMVREMFGSVLILGNVFEESEEDLAHSYH